MNKKIILRLFLLVALSVSLYSCIHDDVYSSSDPASKEYHSKSVWKEDEVYIKNVMKVYFEHETEIKKVNGTPLWDYAMTMGHTDESFLIVPVADGSRIVSCIQVPRNGDQISFMYENDPEHIKFFQGYTTLKNRKPIKTEPVSSPTDKPALAECSISSVSMWYPDNETNPNYGHWETNYIVTCPPEPIDGSGGAPQGPTYPYPGGGGSQPPQQNQNPCAKLKAQNQNANFKGKVSALDKPEMFTKDKETGFAAAYGTVPYQQMLNSPNGNVKLPDGNKYFGFMHVHLNLEGVVKIFSPYDITTFLTSCVRNAQQSGNIADAYAMVITSQGNYILKYSGDGSYSIGPNQLANWQTWYDTEFAKIANEDGTFSQDNVEKLFTQFLEQKVDINGLEVYKSDKTTGDTSKMEYNGKDNPVTSTPCP